MYIGAGIAGTGCDAAVPARVSGVHGAGRVRTALQRAGAAGCAAHVAAGRPQRHRQRETGRRHPPPPHRLGAHLLPHRSQSGNLHTTIKVISSRNLV